MAIMVGAVWSGK